MSGRCTLVKYWYMCNSSANKTFSSKYFTNHYTANTRKGAGNNTRSSPLNADRRYLKVNSRSNSIFASWAQSVALYLKL